jgi:protein SCO1
MQRSLTVFLLGALLSITALMVAYTVFSSPPRPFHGTHLGPGISAHDFTLEAHEGAVSLSDFRGQAVLMFFGYTQCPDVCPITMGKLRRTVELLGDRGRDVQVLLVTVDPEMDTPARLREFLDNFDPSFVGLTGSRDQLEAVTRAYGVYAGEPQDPPAGAGHDHGAHGDHGAGRPPPRLIDHTSQVFGISRRGEFRMLWGGEVSADDIAEDVRRLLRM